MSWLAVEPGHPHVEVRSQRFRVTHPYPPPERFGDPGQIFGVRRLVRIGVPQQDGINARISLAREHDVGTTSDHHRKVRVEAAVAKPLQRLLSARPTVLEHQLGVRTYIRFRSGRSPRTPRISEELSPRSMDINSTMVSFRRTL